VTPGLDALGFLAGLTIAVGTAPVGVSGAVFLLPVQLSVLHVPNPAVTPTNLLFNVIATPGALLRYRQQGQSGGRLTRLLIAGTLPGVVLGALIRIFFAAGPHVFRLLVAAVLLPLGSWLCLREMWRVAERVNRSPAPTTVTVLAFGAGIVGGVYGIGGGSILGPILVGRGLPVSTVAPAALASTFITSLAGAATYAVLASTTSGSIAPDWSLGIAAGLGGLVGGYLGARLQPRVPETELRVLLGAVAVGLAVLYLVQAFG
jgi:uncharacterized membrane protein YfcA